MCLCKLCILNSVQYSTVLNRTTNLSITLVMKMKIVSKLSLPQKILEKTNVLDYIYMDVSTNVCPELYT